METHLSQVKQVDQCLAEANCKHNLIYRVDLGSCEALVAMSDFRARIEHTVAQIVYKNS